jgi:hypothetical protein
MGIDYSACVGIGYTFPWSEVESKFLKPSEEICKKEDMILKLNDETYSQNDPYEFLEALGIHLDCACAMSGDIGYGGDQTYVSFEPKYPRNDDGEESDRLSIGGSVDFSAVLVLEDPLRKLAKKLKKLGLEPGKPMVFVDWSMG